MKTPKKIICLLVSLSLLTVIFTACKKSYEPFNYDINTQYIPSDDSIPFMNGENCDSLLGNPDRGLRMEAYITLGETPDTYPLSGEKPFEKTVETIKKYKEDSPTLCQLYVYLSNYSDRELDGTAFSQLKEIFELYKENNIRLLLRFAYSTESVKDAPYRIVKKHLQQIKTFFEENDILINDTLYCLQTGIIGYWGEGHTNKRLKNWYIDDVINGVCILAPEGIYTQVRTYDMLKKVSTENVGKVGIHDDYIIGDISHKWSFIPSGETEAFKETILLAKLTVNDGEMPWGRAKLDDSPDGEPLNSLEGKAVLKQLSTYSITSFSLEHNYREDGNKNSMAKWKNQYLSYDDVAELGISINPELFKNAKGESIKLSVYDIIRYHLGYQLVLSNYAEEKSEVTFSITNYGFAAPLNFNYLAVVFRDKLTGEQVEVQVEKYDKTALQSGTSVAYKVNIPENCEPVGVKMDMFKDRGVNPTFANATPFVDGVQYFH